MKPFNLEEAKAGKPVCTRDGYDARILCFDAKNPYFPVVALVNIDGLDTVVTYDNTGRQVIDKENDADLMMKSETKTGYINRYRTPCSGREARIFKSKEEAKSNIWSGSGYLGVATVTWEE